MNAGLGTPLGWLLVVHMAITYFPTGSLELRISVPVFTEKSLRQTLHPKGWEGLAARFVRPGNLWNRA